MSITTFGLAANTLVTQGYGGILADAIEDALLELPALRGRRPKITIAKQENELFEEYCVTAELKNVNDKILKQPIKDSICKKFNSLTNFNVIIKDISINTKKNANSEIIINVKCLTYKQPKKFKK